ncbi:MAG: branched-chain amino acid ABC transporter permease [Nitrospiraceae bacterium]|nr:branched-chain amino acid ABC transporter permease [Nitrospiraceae bacterium]
MKTSRYTPAFVLLIVIAVIQLLTLASGKSFYLTQLTMTAYYSLIVIGLCLLMGFAGQISLGHAGFFAIGGYTSAVLTTLDLSAYKDRAPAALLTKLHILVFRQDLYGGITLCVHPWVAFVAAVLLALGVAWAIGIPVLRLKGHYLAMATLGFGTIIYSIVLGTQTFGAADGISSVPPFPLGFGMGVSGETALRVLNYYIAWILVTAAMVLSTNLIHSRVGRALRSIHGAEDAASAMGVDTARFKLYTFMLSAVLAAVAGVFLTHYNGGIGPSEAGVMKSVRYVAIVAVGGMGSIWGTLIMSVVLNFCSLRGYFGSYDDAVFGAILIVIMLFAPDGIIGSDLQRLVKKVMLKFKSSHGDTEAQRKA